MRYCLLLLAPLVLSALCSDHRSDKGEPPKATVSIECPARIYFMPFGHDTPWPVTAAGIANADNISSCVRSKTLREILTLLNDASPSDSFSSKAVRLSIELPDGKLYLVDRAGNVALGDRKGTLSRKAFKELQVKIWISLPVFDLPD